MLRKLSSFLFPQSMKQYHTLGQHGKKGGLHTAVELEEVVILWMGRYLKWLPTPKAIHNSCNSSLLAYAIASTTTSVSTVLLACSISAPPEKGKESAATQARRPTPTPTPGSRHPPCHYRDLFLGSN